MSVISPVRSRYREAVSILTQRGKLQTIFSFQNATNNTIKKSQKRNHNVSHAAILTAASSAVVVERKACVTRTVV